MAKDFDNFLGTYCRLRGRNIEYRETQNIDGMPKDVEKTMSLLILDTPCSIQTRLLERYEIIRFINIGLHSKILSFIR